MRALLVAVLFLGAAASAAELRDFENPDRLAAVDHGNWKSHVIHKEKGFSVHLIRVPPGSLRNVYRLKAHSLGLSVHRQRLTLPKPFKKTTELERGDFSFQEAGRLSGGWAAGAKGKGVDTLFISRAAELPVDVDRAQARQTRAEKGPARGELYTFLDARAQVDGMKGTARLHPVFEGPGLTVNLLRLTGRAKFENPTSNSAVVFAVEGSATARAAGPAADVRGKRVFIAAPGATVSLEAPRDRPAYLLLITAAD